MNIKQVPYCNFSAVKITNDSEIWILINHHVLHILVSLSGPSHLQHWRPMHILVLRTFLKYMYICCYTISCWTFRFYKIIVLRKYCFYIPWIELRKLILLQTLSHRAWRIDKQGIWHHNPLHCKLSEKQQTNTLGFLFCN